MCATGYTHINLLSLIIFYECNFLQASISSFNRNEHIWKVSELQTRVEIRLIAKNFIVVNVCMQINARNRKESSS
jgi:hypothetical protein